MAIQTRREDGSSMRHSTCILPAPDQPGVMTRCAEPAGAPRSTARIMASQLVATAPPGFPETNSLGSIAGEGVHPPCLVPRPRPRPGPKTIQMPDNARPERANPVPGQPLAPKDRTPPRPPRRPGRYSRAPDVCRPVAVAGPATRSGASCVGAKDRACRAKSLA